MNDPKSLAQAFFAAYGAHDLAAMLALCAPDAQSRYVPFGPPGAGPVRGVVDAIWQNYFAAVPDLRVEVVETLLAEGGVVVVQAVLSGAHPTTGANYRAPHLYLLRANLEGQLIDITAYWDNTELAALTADA